ncbi:MAG TPA: pyruvate synthase [Firmicutes bacterium]|nr:pyruvate synthase [Bacillota bacterium]
MAEMLEIRWHGRGGQGAKTAALLLAEAAAAAGKYVQAFPEYGPERMGAPVVSYNRISDQPITIHSAVASPRCVIVLDPSFIGSVDFTAGMPRDGVLLINSSDSSSVLRKRLKLQSENIKVYALDASRISEETIGRPIPNTPMLGAVVAAAGIMTLDQLLEDTRRRLEKKFRNRPELIEGNMAAISRAYEEVRRQ